MNRTIGVLGVIGLVFVALGAVAVSVMALDQHKRHSHEASCQHYRDALTVAYADPMATGAVVGLTKADTDMVTTDRSSYQTGARAYYSYRPPVGGSWQQALEAPPPAPSPANWKAYVNQTIATTMAARGC